MIADAKLRTKSPALPEGYDYWVLATQTCNLYSDNFEAIRLAEWVGANVIAEKGRQASGADPRSLHCCATAAPCSGNNDKLVLDCDIQARHWTDRRILALLDSPTMAFRDGESASELRKDSFVGWIARSYTRLELSDALNVALGKSKIEDIIDKLLKRHHGLIYGVFLDISDDHENSAVLVKPPCFLELIFVVYRSEDEAPVKASLQEVLSQKVDNPKYQPGPNVAKMIERRHVPDKFMIQFQSAVRTMDQWSAVQISRCLRYSFVDHLSDSGLAAQS